MPEDDMANKYGGSALWEVYHETRVTREASVDHAGLQVRGCQLQVRAVGPEV